MEKIKGILIITALILSITCSIFLIKSFDSKVNVEIKNNVKEEANEMVRVHLKGLKLSGAENYGSCFKTDTYLRLDGDNFYYIIYNQEYNDNDGYYIDLKPNTTYKMYLSRNYTFNQVGTYYTTADSNQVWNINKEFSSGIICEGGGYTSNYVITKQWEDSNNSHGKRPKEVTFTLWYNSAGGTGSVDSCTANEQNNWTCTISGNFPYLPTEIRIYETNGYNGNTLDDYECSNCNGEGNSTSFISGSYINAEYKGDKMTLYYTITNKLKEQEMVSLPVSKIWKDNNNIAGKRPSTINIQLKNGSTIVEKAELSSLNNWQTTFNVPKYDSNGNEINYTIDEESNSTFYTKSISGTTITNTFTVPDDKIAITATKVWEDNENEAGKRPSSVILQVKKGSTIVAEKEVKASDDWKYTFTDLPKYDEKANEINYTIDEKETASFYVKKVVGTTVINTFTIPDEQITINGEKKWEDEENKYNSRPEQITIYVKDTKGSIVTSISVDEKVDWKYSFKLAKYDYLGNEITYSIDEEELENYEKKIDGYDIINIYKKVEVVTRVIGGNGNITGDETVVYKNDSTKDYIIITPDEGYILGMLRINGEEIKITEDMLHGFVLKNFVSMTEDKLVEVSFVKVEENPNTTTTKIFLFIIIDLITIAAIFLLYNKKIKYFK